MPIEDKKGDRHPGYQWRQVQHRLYGHDQFAGIGWRVVAWDRSELVKAELIWFDLRERGVSSERYLFPPDMDLANHRAFVAGTMPAAVYADWLEEQGVPICGEALAVLRHEAFAVA